MLARALALLVLFVLPLPVLAEDHTLRVMASTVRLSIRGLLGGGTCTAFSINDKKALFLTADHCLKGEVRITGDEWPVEVVYRDKANDLAVVRARGNRRQHLVAAAADAAPGERLGYIGYGHGWEYPLSLKGTAEGFGWLIHPLNIFVLISPKCYPGMSGGPIFNAAGEIVSIMQMANDSLDICAGKPLGIILALTGEYWQERR